MKILSLLIMLVFNLISLSAFSKTETKTQTSFFKQNIRKLETSTDGKIGVYAINTANNAYLKHRANERFPMGCTSKVIGVAAILKKSMNDKNLLAKRITYTKNDLTNWTPVTAKHLKQGMTIKELCTAAIRYSDNTAMNLLVNQLGGVAGMNNFAQQSLQDYQFRQDHIWPDEALSGGLDLTDSTTPKAMAQSLEQLLLTDVLNKPQRDLLSLWLKTNTTGNNRIRAGVPKNWTVGDKTGTGFNYGTTNDIGIIWPPTCKPIIVAIYYTSNNKNAVKREDILAATTHLLLQEFARTDQCLNKNLAKIA